MTLDGILRLVFRTSPFVLAAPIEFAGMVTALSMNNNSACPTFVLECAHVSDLGMRRLNNQDSMAVMLAHDMATWTTRGHLLMVADGMGAHAAGELASKMAVDNIPHTYHKLRDLHPPAALRQAIRDANAVIHTKGQSSIGFQGMGTTCSCLVLLPQGALVAHIGDSRVYRLRGNVLEQLTFDHSLVWEMAAAGQMPQEAVPAYIPKNVITRSLGPHPSVNIDIEGPYNAAAGDVFLVCSDGLSGQVTDEELAAILQVLAPNDAVQTLVDLANLRGGPDNISVIIARVASNGAPTANCPPSDNGAEMAPIVNPGRPVWVTALLGITACILLVVLAYCIVNEHWNGVFTSSLGLVFMLLIAIAGRPRMAPLYPPVRPIGGPYGNGPYRKTQAEPNRKIVDALAGIAAELRKSSDRVPADAAIDWLPYDAQCAEAAATAESGDNAAAIRQYAEAIRNIMRQLRDHRPRADTGSFDPPVS
jgi:serine/threonine protein phosphatase PrpC